MGKKTLVEILSNENCKRKYQGLREISALDEVCPNFSWEYKFDDVEYLFYASLNKLVGISNLQIDPWHDFVLDWLSDTKGKNLIISGGVGIGKTLVLHAIRNVINYNRQLDEKGSRITMELLPYYEFKFDGAGGAIRPMSAFLGVDDLGCEEDVNDFGHVKNWFSKYVSRNYISRNQTFVVTTNLTPEEMFARYGARTMDRLAEMTKFVLVQGQKSHRHNGFTFDKI